MPKKRHQIHKDFTNQHPHRPHHLIASTAGASSSTHRTVNERLAQLRSEQASRPTPAQRDEITTLATTHSLPPNIRRLLNVPESLPPVPKRRARIINGHRVAPGPAAPMSWLAASVHAPREVRNAASARMGGRRRVGTQSFTGLAILGDDGHPLPKSGSLVDLCLRSLAANWEFVAEYESLNLAALPVRWKTALLSYLGVHGPADGVTIASLKTLFLAEDELEGGTGGEDLVRLDLNELITARFGIGDLHKFLYRKKAATEPVEDGLQRMSLQQGASGNGTTNSEDAVADCWEEAASELSIQHHPITGPLLPRFPNLTRLSLARPGPHASWSALLTLSPHLSQLTHLSLAHWPPPTTTPNSTKTFITHNHASIPLSGTHLYAALDDDWAEAASILKRLANNTYRLRWLDLEGCAEWLPALTWRSSSNNQPGSAGGRIRNRWVDRTFGTPPPPLPDAPDESPAATEGPDWNAAWEQVTYVNISQGVIPRDTRALRAYPAGVVAAELLLWLRNADGTDPRSSATEEDEEEPVGIRRSFPGGAAKKASAEDWNVDIPLWLQREKEARAVARKLRARRAEKRGRFCVVDLGWEPPVAAAALARKARRP